MFKNIIPIFLKGKFSYNSTLRNKGQIHNLVTHC